MRKFKTTLAVRRASQRWRERNRQRSHLSIYKSSAKHYIKKADLLQLKQISSLIEKRIVHLRKES